MTYGKVLFEIGEFGMGWWNGLSWESKLVWGSGALLVLWIGSGMFGKHAEEVAPSTLIPEVQVSPVVIQPYERSVTVSGFTEAENNAMLAAQTSGRVEAVPAVRGQAVKVGTVLVALDPADRLIRLNAAQAELARTRKLAEAARALAKEGYLAGTVLAEREANYQSAVEKMAAAKLDMRYTEMAAPFDGIVEDVMVTAGDFVNVGTPMVKLVGRENILLVGYVAQADRNLLATGVDVSATLMDGTAVPAVLRAVATDADPATRTYRVEALIDGSDTPVPTGMSAEMRIPAGTVQASRLAHDWMVLNDAGDLGVMTVQGTSPTLARFAPVTPLADTPTGIWVLGLEANMRLVTLGQTALKDGALVQAREVTP